MNTRDLLLIAVFVFIWIFPFAALFTFPFLVIYIIWDTVLWYKSRKASKEFDAWYAEYERKHKQD